MRTRSVVLALLVLLSIITYMDRVCISFAGPRMQHDLKISPDQWGWVLGAFLLAYGLFEIPSGALGDRIGQRRVLTRIVLWWSAFTMLTGVVRHYYLLVATRFLFGAGEAGAYPNASGCIGRWFPATERARAQGIVWGASRLGGALTPFLVVPLMGRIRWQAAFWIFGSIGLIWAAIWWRWFRDDPAKHPAVTPAELAEIGPEPTGGGHHGVPWVRLLKTPQLWLIMAMYWFYCFGNIFFFFWFPEYVMKGRGISEDHAKYWGALPYLLGALVNFTAGWLSDWLTTRHGLAIGRKAIGICALATGAVLMLAAARTSAAIPAVVLLALCFGLMDGMLPCSWAICLDVGKQHSGAVSGAMNSAGQAAGYVCTVLYGYLVESYGYDRPLLFLAPNLLISAVLFALIDPTRPLIPSHDEAHAAKAKEPACV